MPTKFANEKAAAIWTRSIASPNLPARQTSGGQQLSLGPYSALPCTPKIKSPYSIPYNIFPTDPPIYSTWNYLITLLTHYEISPFSLSLTLKTKSHIGLPPRHLPQSTPPPHQPLHLLLALLGQ